jgi:hypothetical protein
MAGVALDFDKLPTGGNITWVWVPTGGITNVDDIPISQVNPTAGTNLSKNLSVSDTDFGVEASNTNADPSFADTGNVADRGAAQYGGGTTHYYPRNWDDPTNIHSIAFDLLSPDRVSGYWVRRIDGAKSNSTNIAAGDYLSVFEVMADAQSDSLGGEEAQKYTLNWLSRGNLSVYTVARSGSAALVVPATATPAPSAKGRFEATLNGRFFGGAEWSTSDPDVIEVYPGGFYVVTGADTDTATVTVTHGNLSHTIAVTITA